eukprot:2066695-Pyramimonas_sp.AAC.1
MASLGLTPSSRLWLPRPRRSIRQSWASRTQGCKPLPFRSSCSRRRRSCCRLRNLLGTIVSGVGGELRTESTQIGTRIEQLRVRYRDLFTKVAPPDEDPAAEVDIAKFKDTFSAMNVFLGQAAEA